MTKLTNGTRSKLTGQIGEHLIAAVLGTKGFYASPYSGNVPGFDLTAVNAATLESFPVQVKASNGGALLQNQITKWAEVTVDPDTGIQTLHGLKPLDHPNMIWIFVQIGEDLVNNRFFICREKDVQRLQVDHYKQDMERKNWVRPKNPLSLHCALTIDDLSIFENNWLLLDEGPSRGRR